METALPWLPIVGKARVGRFRGRPTGEGTFVGLDLSLATTTDLEVIAPPLMVGLHALQVRGHEGRFTRTSEDLPSEAQPNLVLDATTPALDRLARGLPQEPTDVAIGDSPPVLDILALLEHPG